MICSLGCRWRGKLFVGSAGNLIYPCEKCSKQGLCGGLVFRCPIIVLGPRCLDHGSSLVKMRSDLSVIAESQGQGLEVLA